MAPQYWFKFDERPISVKTASGSLSLFLSLSLSNSLPLSLSLNSQKGNANNPPIFFSCVFPLKNQYPATELTGFLPKRVRHVWCWIRTNCTCVTYCCGSYAVYTYECICVFGLLFLPLHQSLTPCFCLLLRRECRSQTPSSIQSQPSLDTLNTATKHKQKRPTLISYVAFCSIILGC